MIALSWSPAVGCFDADCEGVNAGSMAFGWEDPVACSELGTRSTALPLPLVEVFTLFASLSSFSLPEDEEGLVLLIVGVVGGMFWPAEPSRAAMAWSFVVTAIAGGVCG